MSFININAQLHAMETQPMDEQKQASAAGAGAASSPSAAADPMQQQQQPGPPFRLQHPGKQLAASIRVSGTATS